MGVTVLPTIITALFTFSVVPLTYIFNTYTSDFNRNVRLGIGAIMALVEFLLVYLLTRQRVRNNLYYALTVLCFSSGIEVIIALELDGHIEKSLSALLAQEEPYTESLPILLASYFYGTFGFSSYMYMIYCLTNGSTFKNTGLHISAAALSYVTTILIAAGVGQSQLCIQTIIHVPFIICLICIMVYCLIEERKREELSRKSCFIDRLLAFLSIGSAVVCLVKGLVCLGQESYFIYWYENDVEPILKQTIPLPVFYVQGLLSFFYFLPAYLVLAGALLKNPGQEWVHSLSSILAGATLQAGIFTVVSSLHPLTELVYRAPSHSKSTEFVVFWGTNILMTITPQLVTLRLSCRGEKRRIENSMKSTLKKTN